jgi:chromosome segregation ATPase
MPYQPSLSKKTSKQKAQFEAARAARRQAGGPDPLVEQTEQLKATQSALGYAQHALEETRMELEQQKQHYAVLYNTLHVVRRKQQRTYAAKSAALEKIMETMSLVDQLKTETVEWENRVTELLKSLKFSQENEIELKKQIKALQIRCKHTSEFIDSKLENANVGQQSISLMEKGVYTEEARALCRILVSTGCARDKIGDVIEAGL